jgi:hypothetical protein
MNKWTIKSPRPKIEINCKTAEAQKEMRCKRLRLETKKAEARNKKG